MWLRVSCRNASLYRDDEMEDQSMTIKELRKEKGLTQAAFAQSIGVSVPSIGGYEADRIHPSAKVLEKIKEVYGVEIAADTSEKSIKKETKKAGRKIKVDKKKAPSKKKPEKKDSDEPDVAPATKEKKPAKRGKKKVNTPVINIQSPLGGSITPEEILAKVGTVDAIYIRVDENKAYWVRGKETGSVDLW